MAYKDLVLASGAVGLWELSEATGTFADLYTTSPHALTLTGSALRAQPALIPGGAASIEFNGSASYLSTTAFGTSVGSFTAEAIVQIDSLPLSASVICGRTSNTTFTGTLNFRVLITPTGALSLYIFNSGAVGTSVTSPDEALSLGTPHHIVARFEASTSISVWVDGVSVATLATVSSTALQGSNNTFAVGAGYGPIYSTSKVSNLSVYTKALSALEIGQHAAVAIPGTGASISAQIVAPKQAVVAYFGGRLTAAAPSPSVSGTFGSVGSAMGPMQKVSASMRAEPNGFIAVTTPMQTVSGFSGAQASLSSPIGRVEFEATGTAFLSAELSAPMQTASGEGRVSAVANGAVTSPMAKAIGYFGAICSITLTGSPTVTANATSGSVGSAQVQCPLFKVVAGATQNSCGSAELLAPMGKTLVGGVAYILAPMAKLVAIGTATVTATYEAYAVNLKHTSDTPTDEVTHYTNFPFDKIVRYKNSYFGMNSTGLYLLEGTTDDAVPTKFVIKTAIDDFKMTEQKTLVATVFGGKLGPAETVTLFVGDKSQEAYPYTTPRGPYAQNYRRTFGRGIKARYYALGVSGEAEFELDTLDHDVNKMTRRI